jgi:hypothetical protein
VNLDAIWYGLANDENARTAMDWISGARIVEGDTSTGTDIYHWRFGPRATTLRNVEWYAFPWTRPEHIPWGGQVQDGGAVLGFTFYDLMARLKVYGPDNAWQRLVEILQWEKGSPRRRRLPRLLRRRQTRHHPPGRRHRRRPRHRPRVLRKQPVARVYRLWLSRREAGD